MNWTLLVTKPAKEALEKLPIEARGIRLHLAGLVGQDGILRAGWQPERTEYRCDGNPAAHFNDILRRVPGDHMQLLNTAATAACGIAALALSLLGQTQKAPAFEVVSLKHTGNMWDGGRIEGGRHYTRPMRSLQYKGVRLSGEIVLGSIFWVAYSPLVKPWHFEGPNWMNEEYFQVEAIAPAGTTFDGARAMLRTALEERLGLKYHLADRDTAIYALLRGTGELKLAPATEPEPNPGAMQMGAFKKKSASLAGFAEFLSSLMDREVVDKTGLAGQYKFDVDWSKEIGATMGEFGQHGDPTVVLTGVKRLGLRLEARKEALKVMVVDRLNKEPTPN